VDYCCDAGSGGVFSAGGCDTCQMDSTSAMVYGWFRVSKKTQGFRVNQKTHDIDCTDKGQRSVSWFVLDGKPRGAASVLAVLVAVDFTAWLDPFFVIFLLCCLLLVFLFIKLLPKEVDFKPVGLVLRRGVWDSQLEALI